MAPGFAHHTLHLTRLPGEYGPILHCHGELTADTADVLRRELALVVPLGHPVLTLDLAGCTFVDVDGILAILHTYKGLRQRGSRLVIVAGFGRTGRLLHFMGIDRIVPFFPNEASAARALRGGVIAEPAPADWETARDETIARWFSLRALLEEAPPEDLLRHATAMTGLCQRSEEIFQELPTLVTSRCHFCPLFYELGGEPQDIGCRSVLDPVMHAVRSGDTELARAQISHLIRILDEMPMPEETVKCAAG
jgi:anti-anti-sigma factor